MANEGEQQGTLFFTREEKDLMLLSANFGDLSGHKTTAGNVVELMSQIERYPYQQPDGSTMATRPKLAGRFNWGKGVSLSTLDRAIAAAKMLGILAVESDPRKSGGQGANTYRPDWHAVRRLGNRAPADTPSTPKTTPPPTTSPVTADARAPRHRDDAPIHGDEAPIHRDEAPRHGDDPYIRNKKPPLKQTYKSHGHGDDGDQRSEKDGEGWPREISAEQLEAIRSVHKLYGIAAAAGWADSTELGMIQFFALARYCRRKGDNPGAFFTWCLRNRKWDRITDQDEDAARGAVKRIFKREREREMANV